MHNFFCRSLLVTGFLFRNHPLFTVDKGAAGLALSSRQVSPELLNESTRLAQQLAPTTDLPTVYADTGNADTRCNDSDIAETGVIFKTQNSKYQVHQLALKIRESCKIISDASYYVTSEKKSTQCSMVLEELRREYTVDDNGKMLSNSGQKLRYRTLKQLSKPVTFRGRDVLAIQKKRKSQRRCYGDMMGLLHINSQLAHVAGNVTSNSVPDKTHDDSWVPASSPDILSKLDSLDLAQTLYVSDDTKQALLDAVASGEFDVEIPMPDCEYTCRINR